VEVRLPYPYELPGHGTLVWRKMGKIFFKKSNQCRLPFFLSILQNKGLGINENV
jgi:hypothetical protein